MIEIKDETEKVILVGVALSDQDDTKESLEELKDLVSTAGAETAGMLIQNREQQHPATYVGKGKIEELKNMIWELRATGIVCDDELSPAQMKNLQDELDVKVMDRTLIILDIFAARASTSEGKIQVELAQLKYQQTRLTGWGRAMSRLGGGIGTRGPGEKKLEMDRRLIKSRIAQLNRELKDVKKHREVTREQRSRSHIPVAAIVGYTNAGKSTLLNALTGAGILAEDKLFATLDPTTRDLKLPSGQEILMTDTVGFIRKLPHHLIHICKDGIYIICHWRKQQKHHQKPHYDLYLEIYCKNIDLGNDTHQDSHCQFCHKLNCYHWKCKLHTSKDPLAKSICDHMDQHGIKCHFSIRDQLY